MLKAEISRVARKEARAEIETLKRASAQYRSSIAALRRQMEQLERQMRGAIKVSARAVYADASSESAEQAPARRFSASRGAAHRGKLGLSAAAYGKLVGVSGQTIYHWEQGKARPRAAQLESLASVRWAAAGFEDTLLRCEMKPEVVHGNEKAIQPRVQA